MFRNLIACVKILSLLNILFYAVQSGRFRRVIGGNEVDCGSQPGIVSLKNATSLRHLCGATLISADVALTAAHCVGGDPSQYILQLNNLCDDHLPATVTEVVIHDLYDSSSRAHDIALLRVKLNIADQLLQDIILPISAFGLSGECVMYGYGHSGWGEKDDSGKLLAGVVRIISLEECAELLGPYVAPGPEDGMLCAAGRAVDSCQGDSGGPLICEGVIQAISSYGMACGVPHLPAVYTSVGAHLRWIQDIMQTRTNIQNLQSV